jgi:tetraacyldisaccharide 4'-kinase
MDHHSNGSYGDLPCHRDSDIVFEKQSFLIERYMSGLKRFYLDTISGKKKGLRAFFFKGLLCLLSRVYYCGSILHKRAGLRNRIRLGTPVVSVGNITWGGTGKTPLVDLIIALWQAKGKECAVLMRGYGADEDALLRAKHPQTPILSGSDRCKSAREFLRDKTTDLFILDDGFQHWRLARDCDIVTINCVDPWPGSGALIPRGALREPLSALARADLVVLTGSDLILAAEKEALRRRIEDYVRPARICEARVVPRSFFRASAPAESLAVSVLRDHTALLFAGVGTPESFRRTITHCGIHVCECVSFPDHHVFQDRDWEYIAARAREYEADVIITTEKDHIRANNTFSTKLDPYVLQIKMEITDNNDAFIRRLDGLLVD